LFNSDGCLILNGARLRVSASNGGQISLIKSLAAEPGSYGITVNSVAPGRVAMDMSAEPLRERTELEKINRSCPLSADK